MMWSLPSSSPCAIVSSSVYGMSRRPRPRHVPSMIYLRAQRRSLCAMARSCGPGTCRKALSLSTPFASYRLNVTSRNSKVTFRRRSGACGVQCICVSTS